MIIKEIKEEISKVIQEEYNISIKVDIIKSKYEDYDYQSNIGFKLSSLLNKRPSEIINDIVGKLNKNRGYEYEITGKGFISIRCTKEKIRDILNTLYKIISINRIENFNSKKILIDYGSPNLAKPLHVAHLRSLLIGDFIARLLEYRGNNITRVNHVGDCGTQFGLLLAYYDKYKDKDYIPQSIEDIGIDYSKAKYLCREDKQLIEESRYKTLLIQKWIINKSNEEQNKFNYILELSRKSYKEIFEKIRISKELKEIGESKYLKDIEGVIKELIDKDIAYESDNAICIKSIDKDMVSIIKKSDGGYTYTSTDLTALKRRSLNFNEVLYVVDSSQKDHLNIVFETASRANWLEICKPRHVKFGLIKDLHNSKISSRKGNTPLIKDLLNKAIEVAGNENIAIGAIKYQYLSIHRNTDFIFDIKNILSLEGNTICYLLYVLSRIRGINDKLKDKYNKDIKDILETKSIHLDQEVNTTRYKYIKELLLLLLNFESILNEVLEEYHSHILTNYLYLLCKIFNKLYENSQVIKGDLIDIEVLKIFYLIDIIVRKSLLLLGIPIVDVMILNIKDITRSINIE